MMHLGWLDEIRNIPLKARLYSPEVQNKTIKYEGNKPKVYLDTKKNPTIGIGSNLNSEDNKVILKKLGYNIDKILSGEQEINLEDRMKLFKPKYTEAVDRAVKYLPDFYKQPNEVQDLLVDLSYNVTNDLYDFKNLKQSLINKNYSKAASDLKDSEYYKQTGNRSIDHYNTLLNFPNKYKVVGTDSEIPMMPNGGEVPTPQYQAYIGGLNHVNKYHPDMGVNPPIMSFDDYYEMKDNNVPYNHNNFMMSQEQTFLENDLTKYKDYVDQRNLKNANYKMMLARPDSYSTTRNNNSQMKQWLVDNEAIQKDNVAKAEHIEMLENAKALNQYPIGLYADDVHKSTAHDPAWAKPTMKQGGLLKYPNGGTPPKPIVPTLLQTPVSSLDSLQHQAGKTMDYEYLKGSAAGTGLSNYGNPTLGANPTKDDAVSWYMGNIAPKLNHFNSAMEKGEAGDFLYNSGKDARVYGYQEYLKSTDPNNKLGWQDANGNWKDRNNLPTNFDSIYDNSVGKLPENDRRVTVNKGRDWYYKNINKKPDGTPSDAYNNTWYGRIWNTNDYNDFNPNNPNFKPKQFKLGGVVGDPTKPFHPITNPTGTYSVSNNIVSDNTNVNTVITNPELNKTTQKYNKIAANPGTINQSNVYVPYVNPSVPNATQVREDAYNEAVLNAQNMGQSKVVLNDSGGYDRVFDPTASKATGRIEPDYLDPITMAATFGAGAYGKGLGLAESFGIGLDAGTYGLSSLGKSAGKLGLNALKNSTESGVLSNTWKVNPWAFKPDPSKFYRQIGNAGLEDAVSSKIIRSADQSTFPRPYFVEGKDFEKLYSTGSGAHGRPNVIFETPGITNEGLPFVSPANASADYTPWIANMAEVPLTEGRLLKQNWLKGYKEVPTFSKSVGNIFSSKKESIPDWLLEEMRFKSLPELNNPKASEVLENFRTRIGTPEGKKRLKELGITNTKVLDNLKIVEDENTLGQYWHNRIGLNPELPEVRNVTRHEIEHGVQDVLESSRWNKYSNDSGNFKYLFRPKARKEAMEVAMKPTSDIDDILGGLELRKTPEKVDWKQLKETQGKKDPSRLFEYMGNKQKATNYFDSGSGGKEKSAFLGEVQQYMMDNGTIPSKSYTEITPEMVKETFINGMFDEKGGGKYLRLFNIMKPTENNYKLISKALNKMLTVAPVVGAAAIGAGALQQKKYGGTVTNNWLDKL